MFSFSWLGHSGHTKQAILPKSTSTTLICFSPFIFLVSSFWSEHSLIFEQGHNWHWVRKWWAQSIFFYTLGFQILEHPSNWRWVGILEDSRPQYLSLGFKIFEQNPWRKEAQNFFGLSSCYTSATLSYLLNFEAQNHLWGKWYPVFVNFSIGMNYASLDVSSLMFHQRLKMTSYM